MESIDTVIIGAGHAGLAMSNLLCAEGRANVVLEAGKVAEQWRNGRWDSFTLLTPNWAISLPNYRYDGGDPQGFMRREEIVSLLERYARSFTAPVREGVLVLALEAHDGTGTYRLRTSDGDFEAGNIVIATGPFQTPRVPAWAAELPRSIAQLHSSAYRNPAVLPPGAVLVVGSGASGQQIAEDLLRAGRKVYICVGRNANVPRRYRGHDFLWWQEHGGFYEKTADDIPLAKRRGGVSNALTGYGGGHDISPRHLHAQGATLLGRAMGIRDGKVQLGRGLKESLAEGDRAYDAFVTWVELRVDQFEGAFTQAEPAPTLPYPPEPPADLDLEVANVTAVVCATGFRPDYDRWVRLPVLDGDGYPVHERGATACPGVYILGREWLHRARSPFIRGAEEDARHIAKLMGAGQAGRTR
ncbi:MAG: NAD(P)-binding domain-containing protein [Acidimicrobiales bacterium]